MVKTSSGFEQMGGDTDDSQVNIGEEPRYNSITHNGTHKVDRDTESYQNKDTPKSGYYQSPRTHSASNNVLVEKSLARRDKKKRAKKNAWTTSEQIEGHFEAPIPDLLKILGDENSHSVPNKEKKTKKPKHIKNTEKVSGTHASDEVTDSIQSSCTDSSKYSTDDSDNELKQSKVANDGLIDKFSGGSVNRKVLSNGSELPSESRGSTSPEVWEGGFSDGEFQDVKRKKKSKEQRNRQHAVDSHNETSSKQKASSQSFHPSTKHQSDRPRLSQSNGALKFETNNGKAPESQKSSPKDIDLSIDAFPTLVSNINTSLPAESASATDDDERDSVQSQLSSEKQTWANVTAQLNGKKAKPLPSINSQSNKKGDSIPLDTKDLTASKDSGTDSISNIKQPSHSNNQSDDMLTKQSDETNLKSVNSVMKEKRPVINNQLPNIEFGTVTSSNDSSVDRQVKSILSQSSAQAQIRSSSSPPHGPSQKTKSHINIGSKAALKQNARSNYKMPVEFLDNHTCKIPSDIGVTFGFVEDSCIGNTYAPDNRMFMSYPPPSNSAQASRTAMDIHMYNHQMVKRDSNSKSVQLDVDIESTKKAVKARKNIPNVENISGFDLYATVQMLREEWNRVQKLEKSHCKDIRYVKITSSPAN